MNRPRRLHRAGLLCAALLCNAAAGLGLGELDVASPLGEPLQAVVALRGVEQWSERQLSVTASAQLPGQPAQRLSASFEQSMAGAALLISSRQRINAALFEVELTVHTPAGELQRNYSVALALPAEPAASAVPSLEPLELPAAPAVAVVQALPDALAEPASAPAATSSAALAVGHPAPPVFQSIPPPADGGCWWTAALVAAALIGVSGGLRTRLKLRAARRRRQPAPAAAPQPSQRAAIAYVATPAPEPDSELDAEPVKTAAAVQSPLSFQLVEAVTPSAAAAQPEPSRRTITFDSAVCDGQPDTAEALAEQLAGCYDSLGEPQLAAALRSRSATAVGDE